MRVCHITNNYPTLDFPIFGVFVKEQMDSLSSLGLDIDLYFINGREKGKLEYLFSIFKLRKYLLANNFDLIHCHHSLTGLVFVLTGCSKKFKSIISYQNDPAHEQGKYIFNFLKKRFDFVILKNNSVLVNHSTVFYQPNGVDIDFFKPIPKEECFHKLNLKKDKRYILFVSSNFIRAQKRYDIFQGVLTILRNKYNLLDIEELKLINTERSLVPFYFNASSLHLLTSDFEGSPNSVKEAMACNIPVVSTNVGNVGELLQGVEGSWVSNSNDVEKLAEMVFKALQKSTDCNSREYLIKKGLDMESVANNVLTIYKNLITV